MSPLPRRPWPVRRPLVISYSRKMRLPSTTPHPAAWRAGSSSGSTRVRFGAGCLDAEERAFAPGPPDGVRGADPLRRSAPVPLVPDPAGAPAVPAAGRPARARMKMGMAVIEPAIPDPAAVPVPVAAYPEIVRPGSDRRDLDDGCGRLLGRYHLDLLAGGRTHRGGHHGIVALDPDPPGGPFCPAAGNPRHAGLRGAVPEPAHPFPALMAPRPMAPDPDVSGPRCHGYDFLPEKGWLGADDDFGAADVDADLNACMCRQWSGAAHESEKRCLNEFHWRGRFRLAFGYMALDA